MIHHRFRPEVGPNGWVACLAVMVLAIAQPDVRAAGFYKQTNLVSDIPGMAQFTDPNLKNPWGISFGAATPFWVSNQGTNTSTLYNTAGAPQALVVSTPTTGGGPQGPTGQVFNGSSDFALSSGGAARFIFANLNGTISAWNPTQGTVAQVVATASAVYTGLAIGNNGLGNFLYAANIAGNAIDVFDGNFNQVTLSGAFADPTLPAGFSAYNVQRLGDSLFVTYESATGGGVVNEFDLDGNFIRRFASNGDGGPLDSPWGLAIAPSTFGSFGGKLLIGNKEDGRISAFDLATGDFVGQLKDENGNPISNTGLWGLTFGNGGNGGDPNTLYFAAGINDEQNGLFGAITFVPEPSSIALAFIAGGVFASRWGLRRRKSRLG